MCDRHFDLTVYSDDFLLHRKAPAVYGSLKHKSSFEQIQMVMESPSDCTSLTFKFVCGIFPKLTLRQGLENAEPPALDGRHSGKVSQADFPPDTAASRSLTKKISITGSLSP